MTVTVPLQYVDNVIILPEQSLDNESLIRGILNGEPAAAARFHDRYGGRISRWVWRLLGGDSEHDDIIQQVFVNLFSSLKQLKKIESLDAWVDSVIFRTVRKELRRRQMRRLLFISREPSEMEEVFDTRSPMKTAHIRSFYRALARLKVSDRMIFVMRHMEGLPLEAIADAGGYSLSTAKRRLSDATLQFEKLAAEDLVLVSLIGEFHHGSS